MKCQLQIDDAIFDYELSGAFSRGRDGVLIEEDGNAISLTDWKDVGYGVIDLFSRDEFMQLQDNLLQVLTAILESMGLRGLSQLEYYHKVITTQALHEKVISQTRFLTRQHFNIDLDTVFENVSTALRRSVALENPRLKEEIITLRISRPNSLDINPMHRDGYLDIYKNTVNLWIPIAGCNEKSSLPVVPGSHYWNEKEILRTKPGEAEINGLKYHVPGIIKGPKALHAIRPNPKYGQALIFSPYLIHGSAINMNKDITRMALELRPCLAKTKS